MRNSTLLMFIFFALFSTNLKTHAQELWGITSDGGQYLKGTIFKTDENGEKFEVCASIPNGWEINKGELSQLTKAANGKFYGMTSYVSDPYAGVIFEFDPITKNFTEKVNFANIGLRTYWVSSLMKASNGKLYGMTEQGGSYDEGILFEYDLATNIIIKKWDFHDGFAKFFGNSTEGSLMQASNGKLYGTTLWGGSYDNTGKLFEFDLKENIYTQVAIFQGAEGRYPVGTLAQASNGKLYGMTQQGGTNNWGVLYEYDPETYIYSAKIKFDKLQIGSKPCGSLVKSSNGKLYGTMTFGTNSNGIVFEYDPATNKLTKKVGFKGATGESPVGALIQVTNNATSVSPDVALGNSEIRVYPNPTKDILIIDCGNNYGSLNGYTIKITNSLSQTVYTSKVNQQSTSIKLNSWTGKGIYFVHLIDASSNTIDIKKIVLQ